MTRPHEQPPAGNLAEARARVEAVVGWVAARTGFSRPGPEVIDAAVSILAVPADRREVTASVYPAAVWHVCGAMVAIYYPGEPSGPVATAGCSCPAAGLCEHLLVAFAEYRREGQATELVAPAAFDDVADAIAAQNPELTPAERRKATLAVLEDTARQIRSGNFVIINRSDRTQRGIWDGDEFPRVARVIRAE